MADNSFALKRWSVLLLTAVIAFSWRFDTDGVLILLALFPVLVFWVLDGYFLWQERLYRHLYDKTRQEKETDFSMDVTEFKRLSTWRRACLSTTLVIFYGLLATLALGLFLTNKYFGGQYNAQSILQF